MKEDTKALRKRIKSLEQQLALLEDDLYRQKRQKRMEKTGMILEEILEEEALISKAVNEAMDEVECDTFGGWDEDVYGRQHVAREMFVIPLIKAVQELSTKVEEQAKRIEELEG